MGEEKAEFKSISIKASLVEEIEAFMEDSRLYRSVAEFFSEAARLRLEQAKQRKGACQG